MNSNRKIRLFILGYLGFWAFAVMLGLCFWAAIIYAAVHFIQKWW